MIAVAVTAANMSPTNRHRSTPYETASESFTPATDKHVPEKPFWQTTTTTVLPGQSSVEKHDEPIVTKQVNVTEVATQATNGAVVGDVESTVPALEEKVVRDQPEVFTPEQEEVASAEQNNDLIGTVKEALGTDSVNSADVQPHDGASTMLTITNLNMRAGPGTDYPSVQVLSRGLRVKVSTLTAGKWAKIEVVGTRVSGWVNKTYLKPEALALDGVVVAPRVVPKVKEVETPRAGTPIRAAYVGKCDCPYDRMRNGRICGGRSAYSRPGGRSPQCYY